MLTMGNNREKRKRLSLRAIGGEVISVERGEGEFQRLRVNSETAEGWGGRKNLPGQLRGWLKMK